MIDKKPGRGSDQFPLRLPDGMRDMLKSVADANGRSMNAEIVERLNDSFNVAKIVTDYEAAERRLFEVESAKRQLETRVEALQEQLAKAERDEEWLHKATRNMADHSEALRAMAAEQLRQATRTNKLFQALMQIAPDNITPEIRALMDDEGKPE